MAYSKREIKITAKLKKQDLQCPGGSWTGRCCAGKGELGAVFGTRLKWGWKCFFCGFPFYQRGVPASRKAPGKWRNQRSAVNTFWMVPVPKCTSWEAPSWVIDLGSRQNPKPHHFAFSAAEILSVANQNSSTAVFPFWTGNIAVIIPFYDISSAYPETFHPGWVIPRKGSVTFPAARQTQGIFLSWLLPHLSPPQHSQDWLRPGRMQWKCPNLWGWCPAPLCAHLQLPPSPAMSTARAQKSFWTSWGWVQGCTRWSWGCFPTLRRTEHCPTSQITIPRKIRHWTPVQQQQLMSLITSSKEWGCKII